MAKKYYAVKAGRKTGLFTSWDEAKLQVEGYSKPVFKSFNSKLEAEKYLGIEDNEDSLLSEIKRFTDLEIEKSNRINLELNNYDITLYVDGSYNKNNCKYGSGFVAVDIYKDEILFKQYSGCEDIPKMRNVTGEIVAALNALSWATTNGYKNILLCYDYEGIELWCTGKWKANKDLSQLLHNTYKFYTDMGIKISFDHIKAHTGNKYNELADELAKAGANL